MLTQRIPLRTLVVMATAGTIAATAGCSSGGKDAAGQSGTGGAAAAGGSVSVALKTPTWILPVSAPGFTQGENAIFVQMQYPSLFAYKLGGGAKDNIDEKRSLAKVPEVSADGKTLTIELKDRTWSDGKPLTTRDIEFWWNLVNANKDKWASYRKGGMPDNVSAFKVIDDKKFSITTDKAYAPGWFIGNQLNKISPLPQHAWDKDAAGAAVSDLDKTPDGAKKVFAFLTAASKDTAGYANNELWKTTLGAWTISSFQPAGEVKMKKSANYKGEDAPKLDEVVFKPFTGDDAEFNVLRSGGVDYGYIPAASINQKSFIESKGYTVEPWKGWSITYMALNFNNPKTGPLFAQKYLRQSLQRFIDQPSISKVVWQDAATPTCGPVPMSPDKAGTMEGCSYSFEPDKAIETLKAHGWNVVPDGQTTCAKAGTGEDACGEGIAAGTPLKFTVNSESAFAATKKMMAELKSQYAKAGIVLDIKEVPDTVAITPKCEKSDPKCTWDMSFFGSQASWYFPPYASGERLFATNAPVNLGSYSNAEADKLIEATQFSADEQAMKKYNDFLAEDLPVLWMPNPVGQISAFKKDIKGISPQSPLLDMFPQDWSRTK